MTAVAPNFGAVTASGELARVIGALLTITLVIAVGALVVCAVTWALTASTGHWHTAMRARTGVWVALGAAALAGAALACTNYFLGVGANL
ncbi:DUF6112 family protein [Georgenia satyanarayanai]|uniref:DUF6112 family protein n=1 Tax=Georgenia satyanarayanai TaxID=860221 RepID=UPI001263F720|nr:DUF6112 family protein [Georgenia satyanarayanai]